MGGSLSREYELAKGSKLNASASRPSQHVRRWHITNITGRRPSGGARARHSGHDIGAGQGSAVLPVHELTQGTNNLRKDPVGKPIHAFIHPLHACLRLGDEATR